MDVPLGARRSLANVGGRVLELADAFGAFGLLAASTLRSPFRTRFPWRECLMQFEAIAVRSTTIVAVTALFTGMVLALQTAVSLTRFGAKPYTGAFVGLAMALELAPVLTAVMVAGRVGAGITAEIGSMKVTEQVDAIRAMGADPVQKLVMPRVLACTLALPLLTVIANILGVLGGMLVSSGYGITSSFYYQSVVNTVTVDDYMSGVVKTFFFGWCIASVGCYMGLHTTGGTVGVGKATTRAVVIGSISVFVSDFFLTKLILLL